MQLSILALNLIYAALGVVLMYLSYRLIDRLTPEVDFPAELDGEIVELCWQYGEKELAFYHRRDEGFAGRRPLNPQRHKPRYYQ